MERDDHRRLNRLAEAYQHEITLILRQKARDPRLSGVWVTHVVFTPDLRLARIYFNVEGGRSREDEAISGFARSKGYLKRELARRVSLKFAPDLKFFYDDSAEQKEKIDELFRRLDAERAERGA